MGRRDCRRFSTLSTLRGTAATCTTQHELMGDTAQAKAHTDEGSRTGGQDTPSGNDFEHTSNAARNTQRHSANQRTPLRTTTRRHDRHTMLGHEPTNSPTISRGMKLIGSIRHTFGAFKNSVLPNPRQQHEFASPRHEIRYRDTLRGSSLPPPPPPRPPPRPSPPSGGGALPACLPASPIHESAGATPCPGRGIVMMPVQRLASLPESARRSIRPLWRLCCERG